MGAAAAWTNRAVRLEMTKFSGNRARTAFAISWPRAMTLIDGFRGRVPKR